VNEGPGASRNLGIAKAQGSIFAFTDSDCVADPEWLKNGVAEMGAGIGLVQGKTIPNPEQTLRAFSRTQQIERENGMYPTCNIFYRKEALSEVCGFSSDFCGLNCFGKPRWGGEDTDLAWRVKKQGWNSVFADDAVIYHHIFPVRPWQMIIGIRKYQFQGLFYAIPYLVKKHPELRKHMYGWFFLNRTRALFDLFFLSLLLGTLIHPALFFFALPYIAVQSNSAFLKRPLKKYHRGLVIIIIRTLRDFVDFVLLLGGSIWNRSIIL
jgi:cellulose synthase/poly-beta-1,6-N-acetylglucosamine synthase-like glycosyltransferase